MMSANTPQPAGQFAQARALYGRSTVTQLMIFLGLRIAGNLPLYGISFALEIVSGVMLQSEAIASYSDFQIASSFVQSFLTVAVSIVLLFLHRSVTFRSADRAACTALPLAGLLLLTNVFGALSLAMLNATGMTEAMVDWFFGQRTAAQMAAAYVGAWLASLVSAALISYASAGTVRLARTKGRRALCILPLLGIAPLACLNLTASLGVAYSVAMNVPLWFSMISIAASLISLVAMAVCDFFVQRNLVYRDTCDTSPAARRYILRCMQEVQAAEALLQPRPAVLVQTELTASAKIRVPDTAAGSTKLRADANDAPGGNA